MWMNFKLMNLMLMSFKLVNLMSMNFELTNLKLVVFLVPYILFYAFLYLRNLIVKKNKNKNKNKKFKTDLITSSLLLLPWNIPWNRCHCCDYYKSSKDNQW